MPDPEKRRRLIELITPQDEACGVPLVTPAEFFDGNDDLGSIGCNLTDHPGLDVFKEVTDKLLALPGVDQVWIQIYDLEEGDWPFAENILVFGTVAPGDVATLADEIMPSEVQEMQVDWTPSRVPSLAGRRYVNLWWD